MGHGGVTMFMLAGLMGLLVVGLAFDVSGHDDGPGDDDEVQGRHVDDADRDDGAVSRGAPRDDEAAGADDAAPSLRGGAGADRLEGSDDADEVHGGGGDDTLEGGAGDDSLFGGEGDDTLSGDEGLDWLSGDGGDDTLVAGAGADDLSGGAGRDLLLGDEDADIDWLHGGEGDDTLVAGSNDWLEGQAGRDVFVLRPGFDEAALIGDFDAAADRIEIALPDGYDGPAALGVERIEDEETLIRLDGAVIGRVTNGGTVRLEDLRVVRSGA